MRRLPVIQIRFLILLISLLFVTTNYLFSQNGTQEAVEVWHHQYFATPQYSYSTSCQCDLVIDDQGDVYVAAHLVDVSFRYSIAVLKYGSNGEEIWSAQYDITDCSNRPYDIAVDPSGNVYVVGSARQVTSNSDGLLLKYDVNGNLLWGVIYDGPDGRNDLFKGVLIDGAGSIIVFGESIGSTSREDYITLKYDAGGNQLWCTRYNGASNHSDKPNKMTMDCYGNIYVTGFSLREEPNYFIWAGDFATIKYDTNGNEKMVLLFNGFDLTGFNIPDNAWDIHVDSEGCIFVTGSSEQLGSSTVKYDSSGTMLWVVQSGTPSLPPLDMTLDQSGNIYVSDSNIMIKIDPSGTREWWLYHGASLGGDLGQDRILADDKGYIYLASWKFVKYDPDKNLVWSRNVVPYHWPCAIASDASGQLYLTGYDQNDLGYIHTAKYTQITTYEQSTPIGENVMISFGDGLNTIFKSVEAEGVTTVVESNLGPLPPSNYEIFPLGKPIYFQITSTAAFTPPVIIQIPYDESKIGDIPEENLKIFHYEGDTPVDITTSVDTENNLVIGQTMFFSYFILAASQSVSPKQAMEDLILEVKSLNLDKGLENSLVVKLENAIKSIDNGNYQATVNQLNAFINHVNSQFGKEISENDAVHLIRAAEIIISNVQNGILNEASTDRNLLEDNQAPFTFMLSQNYPNPFNSFTVIEYQIPEEQLITLKVIDTLGREVAILVNERQVAGRYQCRFDAGQLSSGIYIFRLESGRLTTLKKFTVIK